MDNFSDRDAETTRDARTTRDTGTTRDAETTGATDGARAMPRRSFLKRTGASLVALTALHAGATTLAGCATGGRDTGASTLPENHPNNADWRTTLAGTDEPGEPLVVTGTIYAADGRTPLKGIRLYVYHTDARGIYSNRPPINDIPDARLKGWMTTDDAGRYEFRTIRPAPYPRRAQAAHIHSSARGDNYSERWIEDFLFADDPLVTDEMRARFNAQGRFSPVMKIERTHGSILRCTRDIRLA